jgi:hypothetical protein
MDLHAWLRISGGVLALLLYAPLVRHALRHNGAGQSFAMWFLWAVLDTTLTISIVVQRGNFLLPAGFAVGSISLTLLLLAKGRFSWSRSETVISAMVVASLAVWKLSGPKTATVAATIAIVIAGWPALVELWRNPQRGLAHVWLGYTAANALAFLGGLSWSIEERFAPGVFATQTLAMALIGYRHPPAASPMDQPGQLHMDSPQKCPCTGSRRD